MHLYNKQHLYKVSRKGWRHGAKHQLRVVICETWRLVGNVVFGGNCGVWWKHLDTKSHFPSFCDDFTTDIRIFDNCDDQCEFNSENRGLKVLLDKNNIVFLVLSATPKTFESIGFHSKKLIKISASRQKNSFEFEVLWFPTMNSKHIISLWARSKSGLWTV